MRFLSLFSGIEAATCAWNPLGWECAAVAEIEPFPCSLLKHHYPEVPNLGDVTKITADQVSALGHIDLVCGGFPCQDLSVAGKRKGLQNADGSATRSGLFFDAMRIADWANPRWLFIENVPGMFSSNSGRDFAAVVGEMAGCEFAVPQDGWRNAGVVVGPRGLVEWSVMDAQYHGLAQRRRRVFIVRDSGDWSNRPPLFLEPYRLQGHPAPSRETRKGIAGTLSARTKGGGGLGTDFELGGGLIPLMHADISPALKARDSKGPSSDGDGDGAILVPMCAAFKGGQGSAAGGIGYAVELSPTLSSADSGSNRVPVLMAPIAFPERMSATQCASTENLAPSMGALNPTSIAYTTKMHNTTSNNAGKIFEERTAALDANSPPPALLTAMAVRRLTPGECESLQGFPQGYTNVPHRGKPAADGNRYKALGNSWAVPNVRWIGERIQSVALIGQAQTAINLDAIKDAA